MQEILKQIDEIASDMLLTPQQKYDILAEISVRIDEHMWELEQIPGVASSDEDDGENEAGANDGFGLEEWPHGIDLYGDD